MIVVYDQMALRYGTSLATAMIVVYDQMALRYGTSLATAMTDSKWPPCMASVKFLDVSRRSGRYGGVVSGESAASRRAKLALISAWGVLDAASVDSIGVAEYIDGDNTGNDNDAAGKAVLRSSRETDSRRSVKKKRTRLSVDSHSRMPPRICTRE
jgi:hypothetical protein